MSLTELTEAINTRRAAAGVGGLAPRTRDDPLGLRRAPLADILYVVEQGATLAAKVVALRDELLGVRGEGASTNSPTDLPSGALNTAADRARYVDRHIEEALKALAEVSNALDQPPS